MSINCSGAHKSRLFVGEGGFKGVCSLLKKHEQRHPNLGKSITATELSTLKRTSDSCERCSNTIGPPNVNIHPEDTSGLPEGPEDTKAFCSDRCARIQALKERGVIVCLGYDATKMEDHPLTKGKIFPRIHWNCPHDRSSYFAQTLPPLIEAFFKSASFLQKKGHRIHVTLAQPSTKEAFYQAVVYNIRKAAKTSNYLLFAKRPFGKGRYKGYEHEKTGSTHPAEAAETLREFVFVKEEFPKDRAVSKYMDRDFRLQPNDSNDSYTVLRRDYYIRDTDDESSSYSDEDNTVMA